MAGDPLAGSVHTGPYKHLLAQLVQARDQAGLSQAQLAQRLGKPPSFVGKYELGERRLDVIELLVILRTLEANTAHIVDGLSAQLPEQL